MVTPPCPVRWSRGGLIELTFKKGDPTWTRLRERAKTDLYFLCHDILGLADKIPMRLHAHRLLCKVVEGSTGAPDIDDAPYLMLLLPRDWGKSAIITKGLPIQCMIRDPDSAGLIFNEKLETASQFLESIKHTFDQNNLFRALFPELIPPSKQDTTWSTEKIVIERSTGRSEPSVKVSGVGAAIAGNHPDYIIVDDMISREASEAARRGNWQIMESTNRWTHSLEALLSNQSPFRRRIVFIGTHWFMNDCYDHLKEYFGYGAEPKEWLVTIPVEDGRKQTLPIRRYGKLVVLERSVRENGQWSWPEKYSEEQMLRLQAEDPVLFASNFLNIPAADAVATFKSDWLKTYTWLDPRTVSYVNPAGTKVALHQDQMDVVMIVDPGGFGKGTEDRARAAIVIVAHTPTGEYLILDCWSDRDTYVACQQQVVQKARQYRVRKVAIEVEGQQRVFYDQTAKLLREANLPVAMEEVKTEGKHKDDRILALEPFFQRGLLYIGTGAVFSEFRTQYGQFPRSARRDLLDALAYMPRVIRPRLLAPTSSERRDQELQAYYRRRGLTYPGATR